MSNQVTHITPEQAVALGVIATGKLDALLTLTQVHPTHHALGYLRVTQSQGSDIVGEYEVSVLGLVKDLNAECGHTYLGPCELPAGHDGNHKHGPAQWGA